MAEAAPTVKDRSQSRLAGGTPDPGSDDDELGPSASVRGLNRLLFEARGILRIAATLETLAAAIAGGVAGVVVAAVVVGLVPFSVLLRDGLLTFVGVAAIAGALVVVGRRWLPLRHDLVVAAQLESALRRRGLEVKDLVRSAVELRESSIDSRVGRSRALCDAHVGRAVDVVRGGGALQSLTGVALERAVPTLLSAAGVVLVLGGWWLVQPASLAARLARLFDDVAVGAALAERALQQAPIVTDLTITLRFPGYMQLADEVILGASGDITAPRGTEVQIAGRADRDVTGAALLVTGGPKELALAADLGSIPGDKRSLRARFVVEQPGAWRFRVDDDGDSVIDPVARKILLRPDLAPVVRLEEPKSDRIVQIDDDVELAFAAEDDVGVTLVRVSVKRQGSSREPFVKTLSEVASLRVTRGTGSFTVSDTGARPGEKLAVTIEAVDNDTVSGPKVGRSATRILTVFSASAHHKEVIARLDELLGQMVEVLGDELEAPFAAERDAVPQRRLLDRHKQYAGRATAMLVLFDQTLAAIADDAMIDDDGVRRALANMRFELARAQLDKHNAVERTPAPVDVRPASIGLWQRLVQVQGAFVVKLEKDILYLEDLIQRERVLEAQKLMADMKRAQQDLKELLQQYKESGDPTKRDALLDEIRRMQEQLRELAGRLSELRREVPDEFLNDEAFKGEEMMEKASSLDEMIEEGRLDDAAKALEDMLAQTQKMVDELDKTQDDIGGEENKALREKMERFGDELEALQKAQQEELENTERAMEAARKKFEEKLKPKIEKAVADAKKKAERAAAELRKVEHEGLSPNEEEDVDAATARTADLQKALESLDVEDALRAAESAESAARTAEESVDQRQKGRFVFSSKKLEKAEQALGEAAEALQDVRKLLEDAVPDPSQIMDAKEREKLSKQGDRQGQLAEQAQKLSQLMDEIGKDAPIFGPEHKQKVDGAKQAMDRAGRQLKGRTDKDGVRSARQSQSQAVQSLKSLQEAMEQMGKGKGKGQGMPLPLPGGGAPGSEGDEDGERGTKKEDVKIPDGSDFKVKDAFRKDILDAMREGAPKDWAGEVKRYYEELIK
ncbi:MAG: hypothetical protein Q8O67_24870 [Deltaproteobacteria bacterium]|nr:hypothetical protein [Deltaproteobacteria bacterium]